MDWSNLNISDIVLPAVSLHSAFDKRLCHIEAFEGFLSLMHSIDNVQIFHLIHTIMLDPVRRNIIRLQFFDDFLHCRRMLVICCPIDRMIRI